jgi:phosphate transport system substrate-binding protein
MFAIRAGSLYSAALFAFLLLVHAQVWGHAESIRIDGSSTVYPLTESMAEEFARARNGDPRILLGISGTSGGFRLFCRGLADIANASRPINQEEMAACRKAGIRYLELPVAFDAITVVINPRNTWARSMTVAELSRIWDQESEGLVTRWSDVRPEWPSEKLNLFMPGLNSATSEYFIQVIVGKSKSSRRDVTCSENDNILLQGVARDSNAMGFFGYSYYLNNADKLTAVAIDCGCGESVRPSTQTVLSGRYYPLSRPLFIYVRDTYLQRPALRQFLEFYLRNASQHASEMGYFPLPAPLYTQALSRLRKPGYGTVFDGKTWTGLHIEEVFSHAPKE